MTAYEAQRYVLEHWTELVRDYPGEWVGIRDGEVVAHSHSFSLLVGETNYELVEHIPSEAYHYEDATDWKTRAETAERQLAEAREIIEGLIRIATKEIVLTNGRITGAVDQPITQQARAFLRKGE
jgi:hypothetical protein